MTWNSRVKECIENILEKEIYSTMCDILDIVQSNTPSPEGCPPVLLDSLKDILSNIDSI